MTLLEHRSAEETTLDGEALIREARRLRRRRWGFGLCIVAFVLAASVASYVTLSRSPAPPGGSASPSTSLREGTSAPKKAFVPTHSSDLILPTTLASEHNGDILILDSSRDQILQLSPKGVFSIFAGSGRKGFSGDGGPAVDAELNFRYFSSAGMAVAPNGTVYFIDDGNCRIRAINVQGIIGTIAKVPSPPGASTCVLNGLAVSPAGAVYVSTNSDIERITPNRTLAWVAGSQRESGEEPKILTPSSVVMNPASIAFNAKGDLDIYSFEPRGIFQLSPSRTITFLGDVYATQLTTAPDGNVLAGGHGGEIDLITSGGKAIASYLDVVPKKVAGLNWGSAEGFQEDGIAVTPSGDIYVDNAQGNGYGLSSVLVRIATDGKAHIVPIRSPLARTLPAVGAPGLPISLYPAPRKSATSKFASCPSDFGLEPFTPAAIADAKAIAVHYQSTQYASDLPITDRSWWSSAFAAFNGANLGVHSVTAEEPTDQSSVGKVIGLACGDSLVRDSITVTIGVSSYSGATGVLNFLDRDGHPIVYYTSINDHDRLVSAPRRHRSVT